MLPLSSRLLCFACKLYSGGTEADPAVATEEIRKAAPFHERQPVTLVIVGTNLSTSLLKKVQQSGAWRGATVGAEALLQPADNEKEEVPAFTVEVLVLGEAGLVSLLGEQPLAALQTLLKDRRNPNELGKELINLGAMFLPLSAHKADETSVIAPLHSTTHGHAEAIRVEMLSSSPCRVPPSMRIHAPHSQP